MKAKENKGENTITRTVYGWSALDSAVVVQLGYAKPIVSGNRVTLEQEAIETFESVSHCGAAGGFGGFIYYGDTWDFYRANRDGIRAELQDLAEGLGDGCAIDCVLGFNCFRQNRENRNLSDDERITADDVGRILWGELPEQWGGHRNAMGEWVSGADCDPFCVANACAFFALEETANKWDNGEEIND